MHFVRKRIWTIGTSMSWEDQRIVLLSMKTLVLYLGALSLQQREMPFSESAKVDHWYLHSCLICSLLFTALLYTPDREHFGIVPLEAMSIGLPVIAVNSGGPTESVLHEKTGFLCSQDADEFAKRMFFFASKLDPDSCTPHRMKSRAIEWVKSKFSDVAMKAELAKIFNDMKKE